MGLLGCFVLYLLNIGYVLERPLSLVGLADLLPHWLSHWVWLSLHFTGKLSLSLGLHWTSNLLGCFLLELKGLATAKGLLGDFVDLQRFGLHHLVPILALVVLVHAVERCLLRLFLVLVSGVVIGDSLAVLLAGLNFFVLGLLRRVGAGIQGEGVLNQVLVGLVVLGAIAVLRLCICLVAIHWITVKIQLKGAWR